MGRFEVWGEMMDTLDKAYREGILVGFGLGFLIAGILAKVLL